MNLQHKLKQPPNVPLAKRLTIANFVLSAIVLIVVAAMRKIQLPLPEGISFSFLPAVYSTINAFAAAMLVTALVMIKGGNVAAHRRAINTALLCSLLFLILYVAYHITSPATHFDGQGPIRIVYFVLLISHIVLAAVSLPFILMTWTYGVTNQFDKHRRMAKWIFPIWLYVAVSGPICYLMLRPFYVMP